MRKLFYAVLILLAIVYIAAPQVIMHMQVKTKPRSGLFYMKYGGAICGEFHNTSCGINLKKCADDKEYYCLQDVSAVFDEEAKK